jgi:hypothetical protein
MLAYRLQRSAAEPQEGVHRVLWRSTKRTDTSRDEHANDGCPILLWTSGVSWRRTGCQALLPPVPTMGWLAPCLDFDFALDPIARSEQRRTVEEDAPILPPVPPGEVEAPVRPVQGDTGEELTAEGVDLPPV